MKKLTLEEIGQRMEGQDNLCTGDPIYVVQQRRRIYGLDLAYVDERAWMLDGEEIATSREELEEWLEDNEIDSGHPAIDETGYMDLWEWVQPFFSQKGAEKYIEENRHNLRDPRIFVASAYRNDEWISMRAILSGREYADERLARENALLRKENERLIVEAELNQLVHGRRA